MRRVSCEAWSVEERLINEKCEEVRTVKSVECEWMKSPRVRCLCVKKVQVNNVSRNGLVTTRR